MTSMMRFLAIALIALALAGCVEDKPAPRFSSPDRNERIEAVKVAAKKYGNPAPAAPTVNKPKKPPAPVIMAPTKLANGQPAQIDLALVGRWKGPWTKCETYQFAADGTYTTETLLYTFKGTWNTPYPGMVVCRFTIFGLYDFERFTYRVNGDTLELNHGFGWTAYEKTR